ncbi:site-specific DNA-methyltransferase, partial [Anaerolineae bacterium CFX7]|nr:site-specific DNA-methyltransferase [Anaerolineae bacterium CFX7]
MASKKSPPAKIKSKPAPKAPRAKATPIAAHKHADKRKNIPTAELRDWVADDEKNPKTILYPRDPSLDPQLVWKGKDEQDSQPLEVPAVPIYIQELIQPQAIIENVRALPSPNGRGAGGEGQQLALFADFNDLDFTDRVDFYHHDQHWTNRMILGDSLFVMNSLAEKEGLKGQVQMIYIDPPYGIKFGSNWQVSTRKRDVKDGRIEDATRQPEQVKAFRDTWKLGIHSYLSYLRDRLTVARELLTESGSVFVQIGEDNVHLVRALLDEVFGSSNICSQILFVKTASLGSELLSPVCDYLLWYAKEKSTVKYRQLFFSKNLGEEGGGQFYTLVELPDRTRRRLTPSEMTDLSLVPKDTKPYQLSSLSSQSGGDASRFQVEFRAEIYTPGKGFWKTNWVGISRLISANRVEESGDSIRYVRFLGDFPATPITSLWRDTGTGSFTEEKVYVVQSSAKVIQRCLLMTTDPGDLVLDPTCGSGTTAYVAEQWGRRWITIDTSRVAIALARTRLMAGRFPYYLLQDSPEGAKKQNEITPHPQPLSFEERGAEGGMRFGSDLKKGFVYKRVPHVTLKSIAN